MRTGTADGSFMMRSVFVLPHKLDELHEALRTAQLREGMWGVHECVLYVAVYHCLLILCLKVCV